GIEMRGNYDDICRLRPQRDRKTGKRSQQTNPEGGCQAAHGATRHQAVAWENRPRDAMFSLVAPPGEGEAWDNQKGGGASSTTIARDHYELQQLENGGHKGGNIRKGCGVKDLADTFALACLHYAHAKEAFFGSAAGIVLHGKRHELEKGDDAENQNSHAH